MAKSKKTPEAVASGLRIRKVRLSRGLSLAGLSELTRGKLTGQRIGNYEQGLRELGILEAKILGTALKVHPAYLLALIDDEDDDFLHYPQPARNAVLTAIKAIQGTP